MQTSNSFWTDLWLIHFSCLRAYCRVRTFILSTSFSRRAIFSSLVLLSEWRYSWNSLKPIVWKMPLVYFGLSFSMAAWANSFWKSIISCSIPASIILSTRASHRWSSTSWEHWTQITATSSARYLSGPPRNALLDLSGFPFWLLFLCSLSISEWGLFCCL